MNSALHKAPPANRKAFATLQAVCRRLRFSPHEIARQLDKQGRYELPLDK